MARIIANGFTYLRGYQQGDPGYELSDTQSPHIIQTNGKTFVYLADQGNDRMHVYELNSDGTLTVVQNLLESFALGWVAETPLHSHSVTIAGGTYLYVNDPGAGKTAVFSIDMQTGMLTFVEEAAGTFGLARFTSAESGGNHFLVGHNGNNGVLVHQIGTDGRLTQASLTLDTASTNLATAGGVTSLNIGGTTYVFVTSLTEDAVTSFRLNTDGTLTQTDTVTDSESALLELDAAYEMASTTINGVAYVFVAGNGDDGISTFRVDANGIMTNVANIGPGTGLDGVQGMEVVTLGGQQFIVASVVNANGLNMLEIGDDGSLSVSAVVASPGTLPGTRYGTVAEVDGHVYVVSGTGRTIDLLTIHEIGGGARSLSGTNDADQIFSLGGNDVLSGLGGDDFLSGASGFDRIFGGDGNDLAYGGNGDDGLTGGNGNDTMFGENGDDVMDGEAGNDVLVGGAGADRMTGGTGDDVFLADALDTILESVNGGIDTVYAFGSMTLADNIEIGVAAGDTSSLTGNILSNTLIANAGDDTLSGLAGNDVLYGVEGNNTLDGGAGDDFMVSGSGIDTMIGGAGDDSYIIGLGDVISEAASGGNDVIYTSLSSFTLVANVERGVLVGGTTLFGNDLNNVLVGDGNFNVMSGGAGNDFIVAGAGNDLILGGTGLDTLQGNSGDDVFWWTETNEIGDIIQDWGNLDDQLQFSAASFGFTAGQVLVDGVNFVSSNAPVANNAGPTFLWDADDTALYYDADGAGGAAAVLVADMQAFTTVTVDDFIFV